MSHQDPDTLIPDHAPREPVHVEPPPEHPRTRFDLREQVEVKGLWFEVTEIGERRLVLKPIDKRGW